MNKTKPTIVILHGWKLRGEKYKELTKLFEKDGFPVFAPDLPGFGSEPVVSKSMMLSDYVEFVNNFLKKKHITRVVLIGHSFGGRVSLKYANRYPEMVKLLVLTGVPVIRHMPLKKRVAHLGAVIFGKTLKVLPISLQTSFRKIVYHVIGEYDYYNSGALKEIFKNIVNEDLVQYARKIEVPTVLVWGKDDTFTPFTDVRKIKTYIPNAKTIIIPNIGHNLPYALPEVFYNAVRGKIS